MTVEPIRDKQNINSMLYYLKGKDSKYGLLFKFGPNTGLRISDILPIRVEDIYRKKGEFRDYLVLNEKKTGKEKKIKLNASLKKEINDYIKIRKHFDNSYLFYSNKGGHISRVQAYRVLKDAADFCGIENFGTHSMRKTWGYWTYKNSKFNIVVLLRPDLSQR